MELDAVRLAILVHGTDAQRARWLPGGTNGLEPCCQGFSEAEHGSDLAGIETRGEVVGDDLVVSGQKVWVADADQAHWIAVLCRTEPCGRVGQEPGLLPHAASGPRGDPGLSCVLLPLDDPAIDLRPLPQMSGGSGLFQVTFDAARAPLDNVIGGLGNGWRVALSVLAAARGGQAARRALACEGEFWALVETARQYGRTQDPLVRQQLAWAYAQVQVLRYHSLRMQARGAGTPAPGPEASLAQLLWSAYHRRFGEIAVDLLGADGLVRPAAEGFVTSRWQGVFLSSRADTIAAGTSELQRDLIAEQLLGLPPSTSTNAPPGSPPSRATDWQPAWLGEA